MKINWFSPLPPSKTGIADYTVGLLPILSKNAEITLWTDQQEYDRNLEQFARIECFDVETINWEYLNRSDLNIYHIGNNVNFHSSIWKISHKSPGLVILHDLKLQHFFAGFYQQYHDQEEYLRLMNQLYGNDGKKTAQRYLQGKISTESLAIQYPMTNLAVQNSLAVVTHSWEGYQLIKDENELIVSYIPLPYNNIPTSSQQKKIVLEKPYQIIIFGHLGANRCLDIILDALASFPKKNHFHLNIYGQIWNEEDINKKIQQLALSNIVKLSSGFVENHILHEALQNSDLAINLRYPSMGEASLSQLQIWSYGLPTIVTRTGWYGTLSDDVVSFVNPHNEINDLHQIFRDFLKYPEKFREKGEKGKILLEREHNPENYVKSLLDLSDYLCKSRYQQAGFYWIDRTSQEIKNWLTIPSCSTLLDNVSQSIHFLGF